VSVLRQFLLATLWALIAGCASTSSPGGSDIRIGSLKARPLPDAPDVTTTDSRHAAMQEYQAFLSDSSESLLKPEAMRRLADLNLAQEQQQIASGAEPATGQESRAAQLYKELLQRFPDNGRNDSALYQLARAYEQSGEPQPSMDALSSYASRYGKSDRIDEVQFRRAEYLFVNRDYAGAEQAYQAVVSEGLNSAFHQQSLYKLGWARFKLSEYDNSLDAFMTLLDETIASYHNAEMPVGLARADQERLEDTLRAVSLCFSYLGDSTQVERYFARHGTRAYEPLIYANLAALHLSEERYTDAAETYRRFAAVHPEHPESPLFESRVIDVFKQAGFNQRVLEEKQAFVEHYQPGAAYWTRNDPGNAPEVLEQVQRHLRDIAEHYHAEALQKKTPDAFTVAGYWYKFYLKAFSDGEQTPYMNFLYAELLTSAGRDGEAAEQYERTAYTYPKHAKAADAGYAAVLAFQKHEASLEGPTKAVWHKRTIASGLKFADSFPSHPEALAVRSRTAQDLYALGEYAPAVAAALPILSSNAGDDLKLAAWTVTAHAQFDLGDFQKAEAAYQRVLTLLPPSDERRQPLRDKLAASIYKQGEQARASGALDEAAADFLRVAKTVPDSSISATARYDAAATFVALKKPDDAARILEAWRKDYPTHPLNKDATRTLAVLYNQTGKDALAAAEFSRMADFEQDPAARREASWTAAELYAKSGKSATAITAYQGFISAFPHPVEQAVEARSRLVALCETAGDATGQTRWRREIVAADASAGAERTDRTRFLAAQAQLALARPDQQAFEGVVLHEPLKRNLALKKQYMETAIAGYTEAARYEVAAVTTEATHRIGEIYADFANALMKSERPQNLSSEELEQYDLLLEEQAYPFEEKAIEIYETNLRHISTGHYDEWVQKSLTSLATMVPARYAKSERSESYVTPK